MDKHEELLILAKNCYNKRGYKNYSVEDSNEVLVESLLTISEGQSSFSTVKEIRRAKNTGLFEVIEKMLTVSINEGLPTTCKLFDFTEIHNLNDGDTEKFILTDEAIVTVSKVADGTNQLKRQRFTGGTEITVDVELYGAKIYEELRRLMTKRIVWSEFVDALSKAFTTAMNNLQYEATVKAFEALSDPYKQTGTFDEGKMNKIIDHVKAENPGKHVIIFGSEQGCRKITNVRGADAASAKEDLYAMGYFGHFGKTPIIAMDNAHVVGDPTSFILGDDLYVVASDEKFIKLVIEGDTLVTDTPPENNKDFSNELSAYTRFGVACIMTSKAGLYKLS